jgi:hypothetical protein
LHEETDPTSGCHPAAPRARELGDEYEELLEDMHLIRVACETKDEPRRPFSEVLDEMRDRGQEATSRRDQN